MTMPPSFKHFYDIQRKAGVMPEDNDNVMKQLIARAEKAKSLSDNLNLLMGYTESYQRSHVSVESPYRCSGERDKYPEEAEIRELVEIGRQEKIRRLREGLTSLLGTVQIVDEPPERVDLLTETQAMHDTH